MEVILTENIEKLGKMGDLVKVSDGYARNYLLPKGLAMQATKRSIKQLEHSKRLVEAKRLRDMKDAQSISDRLESLKITIGAKVGEEEKLFGSVTRMNIADALKKEGMDINKKNILLADPIKTTGVFDVDIKINHNINTKVRVWVVAE